MHKGIVLLTNGNIEEFTLEVSKFNLYEETLHNKSYQFVDLGNIHVAKDQIAFVKFNEIVKG